jgi:glycosyltransferase involved in cell wall biosynthesis
MFRMVKALEDAGHRCVVYVQDQHGWSVSQHRETIRTCWPEVTAEVRDLDAGIEDSHAVFATGWGTVYAVLASQARGARLYFVQDFEPAFSPAGSESLLAEATYRFGFHGVTAGRWLAAKLEQDYGMPCDSFDFGCDLASYRLDVSASRDGVAYYCRPSTPRRAHELAVFALDLFASRNPDVPIHVFGEAVNRLPFKHEHHGLLSPGELNSLYNRCAAGLVLSATNVSLVPYEMLAAGCIPVVNDAHHNKVVLRNQHVVYSSPTPFDLAEHLTRLVRRPKAQRDAAARSSASSVIATSWKASGDRVEQIIRKVVETRLDADLEDTLARGDVSHHNGHMIG